MVSNKIKIIILSFVKWIKDRSYDLFCYHWSKNWKDLLWNVVIVAIGVFLGMLAQGYWQQFCDNEMTESKLSLLKIESVFNINDVENQLELYSKTNETTYGSWNISNIGLKMIMEDSNAYNFLDSCQLEMVFAAYQISNAANLKNTNYINLLINSLGKLTPEDNQHNRDNLAGQYALFLAANTILQETIDKKYPEIESELACPDKDKIINSLENRKIEILKKYSIEGK